MATARMTPGEWSNTTDGGVPTYCPVDSGTSADGIQYVMVYDGSSCTWDSKLCAIPAKPASRVSDFVTRKDRKIMKDEIKKYMTEQLKKDAKKEAGQLFKDIEKLKREKDGIKKGTIALEKQLIELKEQLKQMKKEIREEMVAMEVMIERKANENVRFGSMDFS